MTEEFPCGHSVLAPGERIHRCVTCNQMVPKAPSTPEELNSLGFKTVLEYYEKYNAPLYRRYIASLTGK